jgi:hypothetical protein
LLKSEKAHFLVQREGMISPPNGLNKSPLLAIQPLAVYGNDSLKSARNDQFLLLLSGDVFLPTVGRATADDLLDLIDTEGNLNTDVLNGSFSVVIIDLKDKSISVYTDAFNSRKVFYDNDRAGTSFYTSSLHLRPRPENTLDLAAIGSYLANGVIYENRTIFAGISSIPAATRHTDSNGSIEQKNYWQYKISSANGSVPEQELLEQYKKLLVSSIDVRSGYQDHHFISISGGYDSGGIAGIMQLLGRKNVSCFSYIYGEAKPGSDAFVAKDMARAAGYPHKVVQSYKGDLMATILANGKLGEGLANFCDEIDIWPQLSPEINQFETPALFAGDMYYLPNVQPQSVGDAISAVGINAPAILRPYADFANKRAFVGIREQWGHDYKGIHSTIPAYAEHKDLKDHLYVNYRVPHTLMVWREMIQMAHLPVTNPFLDREVMEFVMALPLALRDGKSLYIKALTELSPHLFTQKRARENRVKPDWAAEFTRNRDRIIDWANNHPSYFDNIFSPTGIEELLNYHQRGSFSLTDFIGRAGRSIRYRYPFTNKFISRYIPLPPKELSSVLLLKRVLVLRAFLLKDE